MSVRLITSAVRAKLLARMDRDAHIALGKIASLKHEVLDATMEARVLVAKALLTGAKRAEIFRRLRHDVGTQLHGNAAGWGAADRDVEKHLGIGHGCRGGLKTV
jgi:hypothetical protein